MKDNADHLIEIGVVGRPHGMRGALRVFLHNQSSSLLYDIDEVLLRPVDASTPVSSEILNYSAAGKRGTLTLRGIENRTEAEKWTGARLLVDRRVLPDVDDGGFYVEDIIGIEVFSEGKRIGKVKSSRAQGGVEVVTVMDESQEIEIPLVDEFVQELDVEGGRLTVRDIENLPRTATKKD